MLNRTPFYHAQEKLGAKFVNFFGWEMPVQFTTITREHEAVRRHVGLFDISHMGQIFVWGPRAEHFLQTMATNDVTQTGVGKGLYAHLLKENGTVIDDIYIFRLEEERFLLIVNASSKEKDLNWLHQHAANKNGFTIMEAPQAAALALQGPAAETIAGKLHSHIPYLKKNEIGEFNVGGAAVLISRTGYTGEDGFEFFAPAGHLIPIWDLMFKVKGNENLTPCGLGARDTLRTEVAYPLYGHELDEDHTPLQARLGWVVKFDKGDFIGRDALLKQKSDGLQNRLYGFKGERGGIPRTGSNIFLNGKEAGAVASGTFSPSLGYPIGTAYLPLSAKDEGTPLLIKSGTRTFNAVTTKMPFYKKAVPST